MKFVTILMTQQHVTTLLSTVRLRDKSPKPSNYTIKLNKFLLQLDLLLKMEWIMKS